MSQAAGPPPGTSRPQARSYDSPLRRRQAAETRERIIAGGAQLLHRRPIWDWQALTARAVAEVAGVSERTVYRHFQTERLLRDAVLERLRQEADIDIDGIALGDVASVTAQMLQYVSAFPLEARTSRDPTVAAANEQQRAALLSAVTAATRQWPQRERAMAASVLDVLWSVVAYERMVTDWSLEPNAAIEALTWAIELVVDAISAGRRPRHPS